jgi:hypothetical protein
MPTNRKRRKHSHLAPPGDVPLGIWQYFTDQPVESNAPGILQTFIQDERELWNTHRSAVLSYWVREHPGTRPFKFWEFEVGPPKTKAEAAEEQEDYLRRKGLLTPYELEVLKKR